MLVAILFVHAPLYLFMLFLVAQSYRYSWSNVKYFTKTSNLFNSVNNKYDMRLNCKIYMHDNSKIIPSTSEGIKIAAQLLRNGKLVAFPTETVYGLGANALNESAVNNIFIAKGRPLSDPLIVHISSISKAKELIDSNSVEGSIFDALAKFWPGPLTIIAKANIKIPTLVTAGTGYVGLRFPAHPLALSLLRECDLPIAAPSANRFGHVSPTMATHVIADLGEKDIHVLDGDTNDEISSLTCLHGIESTIVKIDSDSKQIKILRHGAISMNQLAKALHDEKLLWNVVSDTKKVYNMNQLQEAPGQSITHYASDIPSMIVKGVYFNVNTPLATSEPKLEFTREELKSSVIIDFNGQLKTISNMGLAYRDLSVSGCTIEAAHNLFEYLRWTETVPEAKRVLLPFILLDKNEHNDCIIDGLRDRIHRSGSGKVVELIINN